MKNLKVLSQEGVSIRIREFVSDASDLYVGFLSDGRKALATSLLSALVVAVGTLEKISTLAPGPERSRQLGQAATVFHKLSLVVFVSAIYHDEDDYLDAKTQSVYDTAADLSGLFASAARRG